jgi:alkylation response protein AidB-like acyl-CoA dehydrogenase
MQRMKTPTTDDALVARTQALIEHADPTDQFAFRSAQFDAGLAWVHFPEGKGGLGLNRARQEVVDQVLRTAGVRYNDLTINPIGIGMGAPTVLTYGTEEMHERYLRPIFTGQEIWCQLFSEPTHGSDVAGIPSRATRDGDEWVVNGQKVWTTLAHVASFGMLLTRTNPEAPKHRGLSYFVLEMQVSGVDVRPLYQITGEAEFNEVFFTDVRLPAANMLGAEGDGWRVATTTLMNERVALGGGSAGKGGGAIRSLMGAWERRREELAPHERAVYRDRVSNLWIRSEVLRLTNQRNKALAQSGAAGPQGSIGKLMSAELNQRIYDTCVELLGAEGLLHRPGYEKVRPKGAHAAHAAHEPSSLFLRSRANTIEGGTSEIMRNILGERVLGLPSDIRVDKDIPWTQIPR